MLSRTAPSKTKREGGRAKESAERESDFSAQFFFSLSPHLPSLSLFLVRDAPPHLRARRPPRADGIDQQQPEPSASGGEGEPQCSSSFSFQRRRCFVVAWPAAITESAPLRLSSAAAARAAPLNRPRCRRGRRGKVSFFVEEGGSEGELRQRESERDESTKTRRQRRWRGST